MAISKISYQNTELVLKLTTPNPKCPFLIAFLKPEPPLACLFSALRAICSYHTEAILRHHLDKGTIFHLKKRFCSCLFLPLSQGKDSLTDNPPTIFHDSLFTLSMISQKFLRAREKADLQLRSQRQKSSCTASKHDQKRKLEHNSGHIREMYFIIASRVH